MVMKMMLLVKMMRWEDGDEGEDLGEDDEDFG